MVGGCLSAIAVTKHDRITHNINIDADCNDKWYSSICKTQSIVADDGEVSQQCFVQCNANGQSTDGELR